MGYTTISVKKKTKNELKKLKEIYDTNSMDKLLRHLIVQAKMKQIDEFGNEFRRRIKEKNLTLEDIIKSGEEIRKEILKERNII